MEYNLARERNQLLTLATVWMNLRPYSEKEACALYDSTLQEIQEQVKLVYKDRDKYSGYLSVGGWGGEWRLEVLTEKFAGKEPEGTF